MFTKFIRLFAKRDSQQFPDDENGDILYRIWKRGCDLSKPREVDFSMIFPEKVQAEAFAIELRASKGKIEISYFEAKSCWDLRFSPELTPSWMEISKMENSLGEAAVKYRGKNDGWGFFSS